MTKILMLVALVAGLSGCGYVYSDGTRVGVIQKLSHRGFVCKTWEGSMVLGGAVSQPDGNGGSNIVANVWDFTVTDQEMLTKVQEVIKSGARVEITYEQHLMSICRSDSNYFVRSIKVLEPARGHQGPRGEQGPQGQAGPQGIPGEYK